MRTTHTSRKLLGSDRFALALALLLGGGVARADRFTRAETNFKTNCSGCHTLGWEHAAAREKDKVDLTAILARSDEQTLRLFLADPARERGATGCKHQPLVRLQVDDLIAFLRRHEGAPPPLSQSVPPRSRFRKMTDPPTRPTSAPGSTTPVPITVRQPQAAPPTGGSR